MKNSSTHGAPSSAVSRRNFVRAAAWTVPAISVAAASPAFAASTQSDPCPVASGEVRWSTGLSFTGLSSTGLWRTGLSAGTFTFRVGYLGSDGVTPLAGVQYTSDSAGLVAQVQNDTYTVTTPYRVTWNTLPAGWSVTGPVTSSAGQVWTFRNTNSATVRTTAVATPAGAAVVSGTTGSVVPISPTFTATLVGSQFTTGQNVMRTVTVPVGATLTRQILNPARPSCDTEASVRTPVASLSITPRSNSLFAARSAAPQGATSTSEESGTKASAAAQTTALF